MDSIIEDLEEQSTAQECLVALQALQANIQESGGGLLVYNYSKFFSKLGKMIQYPDIQVNALTMQILNLIIPIYEADICTVFSHIFPYLVEKLDKQREEVLSVFTTFYQKTNKLEVILQNIIKFGFKHEDKKIRISALQSIPQIIKMNSQLEIMEIKSLMEGTILLVHDSNQKVQKIAKSVIRKMSRSFANFQLAVKRLSMGQQYIYQQECQNNTEITPEKTATPTFDFEQKNKAQGQNKVHYGFIPDQLMLRLSEENDWRVRTAAVEELGTLVSNFTKCADINMSAFIKLLQNLLCDSNFKISLTVLKAVEKLVLLPDVQTFDLQVLTQSLIQKLGDSKIAIRQGAQKVMKNIAQKLDPNLLFSNLCDALNHQNWHVREEIIFVIITIILTSNSRFDYSVLVPFLSKLLDDQKTNVRCACLEALALISTKISQNLYQGQKMILANLSQFVDGFTLKAVQERLEIPELPFINQDGFVQTPLRTPFTDQGYRATPEETRRQVQKASRQAVKAIPFSVALKQDNKYESFYSQYYGKTPPDSRESYIKLPSLESKVTTAGSASSSIVSYSESIFGKTRVENIKQIYNQQQQAAERSQSACASIPQEVNYQQDQRRIFSAENQDSFNQNEVPIIRKVKKQQPLKVNPVRRNLMPCSVFNSPGKLIQENLVSKSSQVRDSLSQPITNSSQSKNQFPNIRNKTALKSLNKDFESNYLKSEEIQTLPNCTDKTIKKALDDLKDGEWQQQFESITILRAVVIHHDNFFTSPQAFYNQPTMFHSLILQLCIFLDSLRSCLCKNAIMCIEDMFQNITKMMDSELDTVIPALLKKCNDTNVFLSETAANALKRNCSEHRVVQSLQNQQNQKNPQIKSMIVICYQTVSCIIQLIERMGSSAPRSKEIERILPTLAIFISDANSDVRVHSKKCFLLLNKEMLDKKNFESWLQKILSQQQYEKTISILEKDLGNDDFILKNSNAASKNNTMKRTGNIPKIGVLRGGPKEKSIAHQLQPINPPSNDLIINCKTQTQKQTQQKTAEPAAFGQVTQLFQQMKEQDWKIRYESLSQLTNLGQKYQQMFVKSSKFCPFIDQFVKGLNDGNMKVQIHSLQCLRQLIPCFKGSLEPHAPLLLLATTQNMNSANPGVKQAAENVFQTLMENIDYNSTLPAINQQLMQNNNQRIGVFLINSINVENIHQQKPALLNKYIIPISTKYMEDTRHDMRNASIKLLQKLNQYMEDFKEAVPSIKLQKCILTLPPI